MGAERSTEIIKTTMPRDVYMFTASAPTSGKTTQAEFMAETTCSQLVRGRDIAPILAERYEHQRMAVPDEGYILCLREYLSKCTASRVVFDNIPRTLTQAREVFSWAQNNGVPLHLIELNLSSEAEAVERSQGRKVCLSCGASYSDVLKPARVAGKCDGCKTDLKPKKGDDPQLIRKGFQDHLRLAVELDRFFAVADKNIVTQHKINASGTVYETARRLFGELSEHVFIEPEMASGYFRFRDVVEEIGTDHMFFSGMAVFMYRGRALMKDFDILVPDDSINTIAEHLGLAVQDLDTPVAYTRYLEVTPGVEVVSNLRVQTDGQNIPFNFNQIKGRSKTIRFMGFQVEIMGLEDLILFKTALGRLGPDPWGKYKDDLTDIEGLMGAQQVNWQLLKTLSEKYGLSERLGEKLGVIGISPQW